ncbi:MAG: hypothetical protein P4L33_00265 [Capsulimonadaceae bacterium]|nr:hypothetical protein [Capsulimonadaceae bacterium]
MGNAMIGNLVQLQMMATATPALVTLLLLPSLIAGHPAIASRSLAYLPVIAARETVSCRAQDIAARTDLATVAREPHPRPAICPQSQAMPTGTWRISYQAPLQAHACRAP